eukprot:UN24296
MDFFRNLLGGYYCKRERFHFYFYHRKIAKRGGGWLPSSATRGCYPLGMLELSCRRHCVIQ